MGGGASAFRVRPLPVCMCRGNEGKVLYKTERKKKNKKNTPAGPVIRKPQVLGTGVGVRTPTDILGVENKTI